VRDGNRPASSGKITRHRLSRGGDRAANNALYRIALVRIRKFLRVDADRPIEDLTRVLERGGIPVMLRSEVSVAMHPKDNDRSRLEKHLGCSAWAGRVRATSGGDGVRQSAWVRGPAG